MKPKAGLLGWLRRMGPRRQDSSLMAVLDQPGIGRSPPDLAIHFEVISGVFSRSVK